MRGCFSIFTDEYRILVLRAFGFRSSTLLFLIFRCVEYDEHRVPPEVLLSHPGQGDQGQGHPRELLQQPHQPAQREEGEAQEAGGELTGNRIQLQHY